MKTKLRTKTTILFLFITIISYGQLVSTLPAYESFDYTEGTKLIEDNQTAGIGSWGTAEPRTTDAEIVASPDWSSVSGLINPQGNALTFGGSGDNPDFNFTSQSGFGSNPVKIYTSFVMTSTRVDLLNATAQRLLGFGRLNGTNGLFGAGHIIVRGADFVDGVATGYNLGVNGTSSTSGVTWDTTVYRKDQILSIVLFYDAGAGSGSGEFAKLWVNPTLTGAEPTPTVVSTTVRVSNVDRIQIQQSSGSNTPNITLDELRVALSWDEVTKITNTYTWTGATDNDWHNSTNWNLGIIPDMTKDVIIPSDLTNYATSTTEVSFNNLTIESGATYIPEANVNITGTVSAKINIANTNWHLIAPPVNSATLDDVIADHSFAAGTNPNIGLATYNTATDGWNYFSTASTGNASITEGMSIKLTTAGDLTFKGSIHQSDYGAVLSAGTTNHFNLIGNPYTSYVNSDTFLSDNGVKLTQQTIWLWNGTSYQTYNMNDSFEIAPGQGFFVEFDNTSLNNQVNFSTTNRSHQSTNTFLRQEVSPNFELFVEKEATKTSTKVYYVADKTTGFDNGYDSKMFGGTSYDFAVFTELIDDNDGDKLAIQTLPSEDTSIIPVGVVAKAGEELLFSIESINLPEGTSVYIEDTINGEFVNLSEATYKTTLSEDSNTTGQFYIHTSAKSLSIEDVVDLDKISIYKSSNNQVTIKGLQGEAKVSLYSLLGKEVMITNISSEELSTVNLPSLSAGVYILKLTSKHGAFTKKITLK